MITGENNDGVWVREYNTGTSTYTERDKTGEVLVTRPLTADEAAVLTAMENEQATRDAVAGSQVFDILRTVAAGTGQFATAAARDAAIRTCARAIVLLVRLQLRRFEAVD